jgi:hypothetical protein
LESLHDREGLLRSDTLLRFADFDLTIWSGAGVIVALRRERGRRAEKKQKYLSKIDRRNNAETEGRGDTKK